MQKKLPSSYRTLPLRKRDFRILFVREFHLTKSSCLWSQSTEEAGRQRCAFRKSVTHQCPAVDSVQPVLSHCSCLWVIQSRNCWKICPCTIWLNDFIFFFLQSTFLTDSTQHVFPHLICDLIYKEIWPCQRRQLKKTKCLWDSAKALGEKWRCGALWFCKPQDMFQPLGFIFLLRVGAKRHSLPQNQNKFFSPWPRWTTFPLVFWGFILL